MWEGSTVVEGSTQSIAITKPPADGAKCVLTSSEGTYYVTTPGNVEVHKTKNDLRAECDHDGFAHASQKIPSHFNGAPVDNVLAGGVDGIVVDSATGADFNYPTTVAIPLTPLAAGKTAATPGASASLPPAATKSGA